MNHKSTLLVMVLSALSAIAVMPVMADGTLKTPKDGNRLLVVIDKDTIRAQDMNKVIIAMHNKMSNATKSDFDYEKLLKKTVNDRLIIQEAKAMQMDRDDKLLKSIISIRENIALS